MSAFTAGMKRTLGAAAAIAFSAGLLAGVSDTRVQAREKKVEEAAKGPKLTEAVRKQLLDAQTKQKAGDNAGALAALRLAEQVPARTADDNFYIANLKISVAQASKDNALLKEALQNALDSGQTSPEQTLTFTRILGDMAANAKDYPTALRYYEAVAKLKPNDTELTANIAKLKFDNKSLPLPDRIAALRTATEMAERAGQKPEEFLYKARLSLAYDAKLATEANAAAQALVRAYPSAPNWESAAYVFRGNLKLDDQTDLDTYRLQRATGAMTGEGQYLDYAQVAQLRGLPGESRAVLAEGVAKKVLDPSKPGYQELARVLTPAKVAADRASLPASEKQAASSPTGKLANATADGYFAHGDYARAVALYRLALSKGGVDTARANMRLGVALAMTGDKAGADSALKAVSRRTARDAGAILADLARAEGVRPGRARWIFRRRARIGRRWKSRSA